MKKNYNSHYLLCSILRTQILTAQEARNSGYAMLIVSVLSTMMFSLMAAYLTMSNITRAATDAYIEGNSTFYAAESGLNKRAEAVRQRFLKYRRPDGTSPAEVSGQAATVDNMDGCLDKDDNNNGTGDFACQRLVFNYRQGSSGKREGDSFSNGTSLVQYTAHTFLADRTVYADPVRKIPVMQPIPPGQVFEGLNAQEYRYTVYSTATTKEEQTTDSKATTVLETTFKNRTISLFQFAAFYEGDLEMNSTSQININGRVHTNSNLYIQPTPLTPTSATTRLLGQVTVGGQIYNRVDATTIDRFGTTEVFMTGNPSNPDDPSNVYLPFPAYNAHHYAPLSYTELDAFNGRVRDRAKGVNQVRIPMPGFVRKFDSTGQIADYYGKADLRLEMFPKRAKGNVPFNFTAIKEGGSGDSCSGLNISDDRDGKKIACTQLNEGQLRSLMQPVMVKPINQEERERFCPTVTEEYKEEDNKSTKILRYLQAKIAAQNLPFNVNQTLETLLITNDQLGTANGLAPTKEAVEFVKSIGLDDKDLTKSLVEIAADEGTCFLPPPIQVVKGSGTNDNTNYNWQSGYYDRREGRWLGMLQTNLASLTIWNRDGVYTARDNNLSTDDPGTTKNILNSYNDGNPDVKYDTRDLLFVRAAANSKAAVGSFQRFGLAAVDLTEGGLVFHATVSEDLDGDGKDDLSIDPADNLRVYPGNKKRESPYAFAFNGGANLPRRLTIATDQALYLQGDFNTIAKQPASTIGDTITILSNSCVDIDTKSNSYNLINCGILSGQNNATPTTVNAAFLSYTPRSDGNIINGAPPNGNKGYSGGLNNYMRMSENWMGVNFTYRGSFVSLGIPKEFSGAYQDGCAVTCYYDVPNRNFSYDTDFDATDRLPPLTPKVMYLQQDIFKRTY
jgi:hypothetical protein